jgi:hypothetical protein
LGTPACIDGELLGPRLRSKSGTARNIGGKVEEGVGSLAGDVKIQTLGGPHFQQNL